MVLSETKLIRRDFREDNRYNLAVYDSFKNLRNRTQERDRSVVFSGSSITGLKDWCY